VPHPSSSGELISRKKVVALQYRIISPDEQANSDEGVSVLRKPTAFNHYSVHLQFRQYEKKSAFQPHKRVKSRFQTTEHPD
jgi:hypothetical protein